MTFFRRGLYGGYVHDHPGAGLTYFRGASFSINEGGRFASIHMNLGAKGGIYVCIGRLSLACFNWHPSWKWHS